MTSLSDASRKRQSVRRLT